MTQPSEHILALARCPGSITAKNIAHALVAEKLAAAVHVLPPVQTYFNWLGKVDIAEERIIMITTTTARYAQLQARMAQLSPQQPPQLMALPASAGWQLAAAASPPPDNTDNTDS